MYTRSSVMYRTWKVEDDTSDIQQVSTDGIQENTIRIKLNCRILATT